MMYDRLHLYKPYIHAVSLLDFIVLMNDPVKCPATVIARDEENGHSRIIVAVGVKV